MNLFAANKPIEKTRVVVAMSGGVDSSVVAGLVAEQGYETIGITLQLYDHGAAIEKKNACCAGQDIEDARKVCENLGIPHYVLNYESLFRESVMEDFADSYINGITPIPCVKCNQTVKFRDLLKVAKDLDADAMVTGHYVQRVDGEQGAELHKGADDNKDQSYFLFATTQEQLNYLHFPLGNMNKSQTREHAERFGLNVADKPESQDICFVPNGNYAKIVEKLRPGALEPGDIVHLDGRVLKQHDGIIKFTVGQRRGLDIGGGEVLYVIRVDPITKSVIVGPEEALFKNTFLIENINWFAGDLPDKGFKTHIKIRSAGKLYPATIFPHNAGQLKVVFDEPQKAIAPGQACVAYADNRVLGGGWITTDHQKRDL
jgi:tRNA-specific 2-thiouridylase